MIDKIIGKGADVSFTTSLALLKIGGSGAFKKYVTGLGGRGSSKIVTECDKGGWGSSLCDFFLCEYYTNFNSKLSEH